MKIADNGVGIFPGCRRKPNSFGLLGIEERVSRLGGEFTIDSATGGGTVLTLSIPVEATLAEA
jgi:signal transduction histidine kinase